MQAGEITKVDTESRVVYGWASVIRKNGKVVVDLQDDVVPDAVMEKAAWGFLEDAGVGGLMHARDASGKPVQIGTCVASFPLTAMTKAAFGIASDIDGWMFGMRVTDDDVWNLVKSGALRGFSVGGSGAGTVIDAEAEA